MITWPAAGVCQSIGEVLKMCQAAENEGPTLTTMSESANDRMTNEITIQLCIVHKATA